MARLEKPFMVLKNSRALYFHLKKKKKRIYFLPWVLLNNSTWPESHQQRALRCGMGSDCGSLLEP